MPPFFARLETSPIMRGGQKQRPNAGILDPANQLGNPRKAFEGVEGCGKCWEASLGARNAYLPIMGQFGAIERSISAFERYKLNLFF